MAKKTLDEAYQAALTAARTSARTQHAELKERYGPGWRKRRSSLVIDIPKRSTIKLVRIGSEWYSVDKSTTAEWGDNRYLLGIQQGYDMSRFLVKANSLDTAVEIAEEKWPNMFFRPIEPEDRAEIKKTGEWPDDVHPHPKTGKPVRHEENFTFAKKVDEYQPSAVKLEYERKARLPDGRVVEFI